MANMQTTPRWQDAHNIMGTTLTNLVAGDVGGTKSWLSWVQLVWQQPARLVFEQRYTSADFPNATALLQQFLKDAARGKPDKLCLAVPGPVDNGQARLTNLNWDIHAAQLTAAFGVADTRLVNDFQAAAAGVEALHRDDWRVINPGVVRLGATRVITGAGTGLGVAWMQSDAQGQWRVYASEGGHMDFSPADAQQARLLAWLSKRYAGHVSWERVLSGDGLLALYQWLNEEAGVLGQASQASEVHALALSGNRLANQAITLFCDIYAAWIGNLCVTFKPQGGLYIAGGVGIHLQNWMLTPRFVDIMTAKGRMASVVAVTPVMLVLNPRLGVLGAELLGSRPAG